MSKIEFKWLGSPDPEIISGTASYFFAADDQSIAIDLPNFSTALNLHKFMESVYSGGMISGANAVQIAVSNVLSNIVR